MCDIDRDNTAWLRADLAANGWYRISAFHPSASNAAWLAKPMMAAKIPALANKVSPSALSEGMV